MVGALAFRFDRRGRTVALENLAAVFGDGMPESEREAIARASFANFARAMLDLFWAQRLTPDTFHTWIRGEGFEELRQRLAREKRGAIFMSVHYGPWEWGSLAFGYLKLPATVVVENFKNPRLTAIFRALRERSGHTIIAQENSMLRMLKTVKRGGLTGLLIDLNLRPTQAATAIKAFAREDGAGLMMCVPLLHAVLAVRAGALLVPAETRPMADGSCRIIAHPPVEFPSDASTAEIAQRCWDAFEPIIRARPELWLWPYKFFRFRPQNAVRSYPGYANESRAFEKLLKSINEN